VTQENLKAAIEIIAILAVLAGPVGVLVERLWRDKSIGARSIQFCAVVMLVPTIIILSLEGVLEPATTGTLIGALTGYLLSGIGDYQPRKRQESGASDNTP